MDNDPLEQPPGHPAPILALPARAAALGLLALLVLYRPFTSGLTYELPAASCWLLVALLAGLAWMVRQVLTGRWHVHLGGAGLCFAGLLVAGLVSALRAPDWFSGMEWWLLFAGYGLTGFLVLQSADDAGARRVLGACLLATGTAVAVYALWHRAFYMPALRDWMGAEGEMFRSRFGLGAEMARDLQGRVRSTRASGHFLTANQLADFLLLTGFPLAGLAVHIARHNRRDSRRGWVLPGLAVAAAAGVTVVLLLTRSKGGWFAAGFGMAVLAAGAVYRRVNERRGRMPALAAAAGALVAVGLAAVAALTLAALTGLAPGVERFAASFAVRLGYWRTSLRMFTHRPLFGVGPGSWGPWYAMLKQPGFEETQSAHNAYLQVLAENGIVGLALLVGFLALALRRCFGRPADEPPGERATTPAPWRPVALAAALALVMHAGVLQGLHPPLRGGPDWVRSAWYAPYALVALAWGGVFAVFLRSGVRWRQLAPWALAGLAAFLLHSAAEVTWRIPAIGGTAMALLALTAAAVRPPAARERPLSVAVGGAAVMLGAAAVMAWTLLGVRAALLQNTHMALAQANRRDLRTGAVARAASPRQYARNLAQDTTRQYAAACRALPWRFQTWLERAEWLGSPPARALDPENAGSEPALAAARRATELSPLRARGHKLQGDLLAALGRQDDALAAYRRARDLHPTLPAAWFTVARQAERAGRSPRLACSGYERALELIPRQYHERNKVPGRRAEWLDFVQFFSPEARRPGFPEQPSDALRALLTAAAAVARALPRQSEAPELPASLGARETARRLALGEPPAEEAVEQWAELSGQELTARLWLALAPRLWRWALRARLSYCDTPAGPPQPPAESTESPTAHQRRKEPAWTLRP